MRFSVYIPLYNAQNYISQTIESVLGQEFSDFELLIVNDGSTDDSLAIAEEYAQKDERVRIITQENKGLFHTRITAFQNVKGDYILSLDADDRLKADALKRLDCILNENKNLDMIMFRCERFDESSMQSFGRTVFENGKQFDSSNIGELYDKILDCDYLNSICFKAVRRECLLDCTALNELPRISMAEDRIHTLNLLPNVKNAYYSDAVLYEYRYTPSSMTNRFEKGFFAWHKIVFSEMKRFCKRIGYENSDEKVRRYCAIKLTKLTTYSASQVHGDKNTYKEYREMLQEIFRDEDAQYMITCPNIPLVYKFPLKMMELKMSGAMLFYKLICERLRLIMDKIKK